MSPKTSGNPSSIGCRSSRIRERSVTVGRVKRALTVVLWMFGSTIAGAAFAEDAATAASDTSAAPGAEEKSAIEQAKDAPGGSPSQELSEMPEEPDELQAWLATEMDRLRRFKLSGYLQLRYEISDGDNDSVRVAGSPAVLVPANVERFYIRRARIKLTYDHSPWSQAVVQFDGSTSSGVRLLEAYAAITEPRTPEPRYQGWAGQFNVPFGYEIERSSSIRELPERSRAENVLFPGERDRGIKLMGLVAGKLDLVAAVINGGGISSVDFPTTDPSRGKDVLGRARVVLGVVDAAVSGYTGKQTTALTGLDVQTDRTRFGFDSQAYFAVPRVGGGSAKVEFYRGHNVNADSLAALTISPTAANPVRLLVPGADPSHFATDFNGGYAMVVQNLGEVAQLAARYDWFDPNEDADHDLFKRWNVAVNAFYQGLTRLTVSYEHPITERRLATGVYEDPVDNLWTFQVQHAF
jgi:hypothetical protein